MKALAGAYDAAGRFDEALALTRRALELNRRLRRPDHPDVSFDHFLLCRIALDRHDLAEAAARCDESLALRLANRLNPYDTADSYVLEAELASKMRDFAKARAQVEQALAAHRKLGPRGYRVANDELVLGQILVESGAAAEARPILEDALAIHERVRNPDAAEVVRTRTLLAEALRATGQSEAAAAMAGRAVAAADAGRLRPDLDSAARFALARSLGKDERTRALELARQARARLEGYPAPEEAKRIDTWLATR
jgi:serine/threonine-protein kinase